MTEHTTVLTGAASGIGRDLAGHLARREGRILLADVDVDGLDATVAGLADSVADVRSRVLDVRDPDGWRETLAEATRDGRRLDVLLNVAGVITPGFVHEIQPIDIERQVDVNVKGVLLGTRLAAEHMVRQGRGHIVNIASLAGVAPVPGIAVYSATKYAVRGFSLAASYELVPRGVAVTVVCPDLVDTPMLDLQLEYPEEAALTFSGPRALTVGDVSQAVLRALDERPREVMIPRSRGLLARIAGTLPGLGAWMRGPLSRKGRAAIRRMRADGTDRSRV